MTAQDTDEKVKSIVRAVLAESFNDEITFGPILVLHGTDEFGDGAGSPYLRILTVHDHEGSYLDPRWTSSFNMRIRPKLVAAGIEEFPSPGFVGKSEWLSQYPKWKLRHPEIAIEAHRLYRLCIGVGAD